MHRTRIAVAVAVAVAATITSTWAIASANASVHPAARESGPAHLHSHHGKLGTYLEDARGHALYEFKHDKHGKSSCYSPCSTYWPPLLTHGKPVAGHGVSASKLGTVKRKDGSRQVTYSGHPLYAYTGDTKANQTNGEGSTAFGGEWYVMGAKGKALDGD